MIEQVNINKTPKVSIGMPVYNGEKYIREALDSLLAQTFTDFELIISDNCSTDRTEKICKEYMLKDSRVKYIRQAENIGAVANFEYVLNLAQGEYFMWAAYDDRWMPECIHSMLHVLVDSNCGLAFSNYIVRNLETGDESYHKVTPSDKKSLFFNYLIRIMDMRPSLIYGLYKIDYIKNKKLELFDFSDVHFVLQVAINTKIKIIDDYLYIAGTVGNRIPYSITSSKLDRLPFLKKQFYLLKTHFTFPQNILLFGCVCLCMIYNKLRLWRY